MPLRILRSASVCLRVDLLQTAGNGVPETARSAGGRDHSALAPGDEVAGHDDREGGGPEQVEYLQGIRSEMGAPETWPDICFDQAGCRPFVPYHERPHPARSFVLRGHVAHGYTEGKVQGFRADGEDGIVNEGCQISQIADEAFAQCRGPQGAT